MLWAGIDTHTAVWNIELQSIEAREFLTRSKNLKSISYACKKLTTSQVYMNLLLRAWATRLYIKMGYHLDSSLLTRKTYFSITLIMYSISMILQMDVLLTKDHSVKIAKVWLLSLKLKPQTNYLLLPTLTSFGIQPLIM